jgi:hypothetical protein
MRYFILLDFQHMVLAFFLGLLAVLFSYAAWCGYPARDKSEQEGGEEVGGGDAPSHLLPPLLLLVFFGSALWLLCYAIVEGIFGGPIS